MEIFDVDVSGPYQGNEIGKRMVRTIITAARIQNKIRTRKIGYILVKVEEEKERAMYFLKSLGFVRAGFERQGDYNEPRLLRFAFRLQTPPFKKKTKRPLINTITSTPKMALNTVTSKYFCTERKRM